MSCVGNLVPVWFNMAFFFLEMGVSEALVTWKGRCKGDGGHTSRQSHGFLVDLFNSSVQ